MSEVPSSEKLMAEHTFYKDYLETDHDEVVVYKRPDSPNFYARIQNPGTKGQRYIMKSLRTKDPKVAKRKALSLFVKYRENHSAFSSSYDFQSMFEQYIKDEVRRGSAGEAHLNRQRNVFERWMKKFIEHAEIVYVEDWTIEVFGRFIEWRKEYWTKNPPDPDKGPRNYAPRPRPSTMRVEMNIAAMLLSAFYIQKGISPPNFHAVVKRHVQRENKQTNREQKNRGFGVTPENTIKLLETMKDWLEELPRDRDDHLYARMRLYWSIRFVLATRLRVGTELYNLKFSDMQRMKLENGMHTYHGYTRGKTGSRYFVMDQDFVEAWEAGWMRYRHTHFSEFGMNEPDAYVFAGCTPPKDWARETGHEGPIPKNKLSGEFQCQSYLQNNLYKKFLALPECRSFRFHIPAVCGGRPNVRLTMYDWRQTAITRLIAMRKHPKSVMAMLAGCSLTILDRHYEAMSSLQNAENIATWTQVPGFSDDDEKLKQAVKQTRLETKMNVLREGETSEHGKMMREAFQTEEEKYTHFEADHLQSEEIETVEIPRKQWEEIIEEQKKMRAFYEEWKNSQ